MDFIPLQNTHFLALFSETAPLVELFAFDFFSFAAKQRRGDFILVTEFSEIKRPASQRTASQGRVLASARLSTPKMTNIF